MRRERTEALLGHVAWGSWQMRKAATAALVERNEPSLLRDLQPLLRHRSALVRYLAANLLGNLGASGAAAAPSATGDDGAAHALFRALEDPDWVVRREAGWALGRIGGESACRFLIEGVSRERDDLVRPGLVAALGDLDQPRALPSLLALVEDGDAGVSQAARGALASFRNWNPRAFRKKDAPALVALLGDGEASLRVRAAEALGALGDRHAVAPLIAALDDAEPEVTESVVAALGRLTGRSFGADRDAWRRWWDERRR
jgi:HEAT repeat protein